MRPTTTAPQIRGQAVAAAIEYLLKDQLDHCIMATAVVLEIARRCRVEAYALVVEVDIFNPPLAKYIIEHQDEPVIDADTVRAIGGYSLLLGDRDGEDTALRWPGHLVAVIARRELVDPTLGQATRPECGVALRACSFPVDEPFLRGKHPISVLDPRATGGCLVRYTARPGVKSYRDSPVWVNPGIRDELAAAVMRRLSL